MANTIQTYKRNTAFASLDAYDFLAKADSFIEVTEWYNGEGFDAMLSTQSGEQRMSFSWGEYKALRELCKHLFGDDEED